MKGGIGYLYPAIVKEAISDGKEGKLGPKVTLRIYRSIACRMNFVSIIRFTNVIPTNVMSAVAI